MNKITKIGLMLTVVSVLGACASVEVTKTSAGFHNPTDANNIEILKTRPAKNYEELGSVTATGFPSAEEATMHNGIRTKASSLGANAVILTSEGLVPVGYGQYHRWASGVAIRYTGK